MNKLLLGILLIIFTSCSSDGLKKLSINCLCSVSAHYVASTDEEDNNTKEFSFTNSRVFDFGVRKESFALSSAILIKNDFDIDSSSVIKVSLVKDNGSGNKKTQSFTYEQNEIKKLSPKYFEIEGLINDFVKNIFENKYSECQKLTDINIDAEKFNSIIDNVFKGLEKGYIDTRIIGYTVGESEYLIDGGVYTENKMLDLFTMNFKETDKGLKIIAFNF
jgi:hypothetical protein